MLGTSVGRMHKTCGEGVATQTEKRIGKLTGEKNKCAWFGFPGFTLLENARTSIELVNS